jgi:hypothetical protein
MIKPNIAGDHPSKFTEMILVSNAPGSWLQRHGELVFIKRSKRNQGV